MINLPTLRNGLILGEIESVQVLQPATLGISMMDWKLGVGENEWEAKIVGRDIESWCHFDRDALSDVLKVQ